MALTVVAWLCSPDPIGDGYPQIRKFWVFCILLLVFSALRSLKRDPLALPDVGRTRQH